MAVHIRLARGGQKKAPVYRVVVTDQRSPRGGRFLETVGTFDPRKEGHFFVKRDRISHWESLGAEISPTITRLLLAHQPANKPAQA